MEQITNKEILEELKKLRIDVEILKERLIDQDAMLTFDEEKIVDEALEEYKRGETVSLEDIEKARKHA